MDPVTHNSGTMNRCGLLEIGLMAWLLTGCQDMPAFLPPALQSVTPPAMFKVLTYNTLHGLEVSKLWVRQVETDEHLRVRFTLRIEQLAEAQPDVILLQEVNPLPAMAEDYVQSLKQRGLDYAEVHQVDACGLRLAPGLTILPGLNNGLVILTKAPLTIRKLDGLKLSGPFGGCWDYAGVQFGELRYALLAEVTAPTTGMTYLIATMHLHSGIERDAKMLHELMEAHSQDHLQHYDELMAELKRDEDRRQMELHTLMEALQHHQMRQHYAGVIFGGDLNFEDESPEYQQLGRAGFTDTAQIATGMPMWNTYDPTNNPLAGREEEALPSVFVEAIAQEMKMDQDEVVKRYRHAIGMARRIDFLFSMAFMSNACLTQELFGKPAMMGAPTSSDHYGVLNTYTYQHKDCEPR
jgi:endonuclease/exonuclease/phosphatase family metal-dependent hydrolase